MAEEAKTRRAVLASLAGMAASACGLSPTLDLLGSAFQRGDSVGSFWGEKPYPMSAAEVDELPYATMGLRFGRGDPAVLVLASYDGDELHWNSADRVIFVTRGGWLVRTVGLPRDLLGTRWNGIDPLPGLARGGQTVSSASRVIDLSSRDEFGVAVESSLEVVGPETLEVLGRRRNAVCIHERTTVHRWRWSAENRFWVDPVSGRVWRSQQQFCPDLPPLELEVLKPAAVQFT